MDNVDKDMSILFGVMYILMYTVIAYNRHTLDWIDVVGLVGAYMIGIGRKQK